MIIAEAYRRGNRLWLILGNNNELCRSPDGSEDLTVEDLLIKASERRVDTVSIRADPSEDESEGLLELLSGLKRMGKSVELSVSPLRSDLIGKTLDMVRKYMLECNPEGSEEDFLSDPELHRSLATLMGRNVTLRKAIGSSEPSLEDVVRLGESAASVAKTAILHQQGMGSVHGIASSTIPSDIAGEDRLLKLGRALSHHVPHVILRGEGFRVELNRD